MLPFSYASCDICDGVHGQHNLFSKKLGHNGLLVLHLSIPLEHSDKFWVYHQSVVGVIADSVEKQGTLYVEAKTF